MTEGKLSKRIYSEDDIIERLSTKYNEFAKFFRDASTDQTAIVEAIESIIKGALNKVDIRELFKDIAREVHSENTWLKWATVGGVIFALILAVIGGGYLK